MTVQEFEKKWKKRYDESKMTQKEFYRLYFHEIYDDVVEVIFENHPQYCKEYYKNFVSVKDVNINDINNKTRTWASNCSRKI